MISTRSEASCDSWLAAGVTSRTSTETPRRGAQGKHQVGAEAQEPVLGDQHQALALAADD